MEMRTWRQSRTTATEAAESLRAAFAALGIPESAWSSVRPVVTNTGGAYVHLGMIRADAVEQIAEALREIPSR